MIEKEQLRIGSKVKCKISNDNGIYTVLALPGWENGADEFMVTIDRCPKQTVPISKIRGVKITTEILKEYGFVEDKKTKFGGWLSPEYNDERLRVKHDEFSFFYSPTESSTPVRLQYLHQLQNLFYILSGSELEFAWL